jgi:hypothetical protein
MTPTFSMTLEPLKKLGWIVRLRNEPIPLPSQIRLRYPWVSNELEEFLGSLLLVQRPDEKLWLLASTDYEEMAESVFAWNEWEIQSLEAAKGNMPWSAEIKQFWDSCLPIALSVADGYAYFGVRPNGTVVYGREPEYEDVQEFASTVTEFLRQIGTAIV